MMSDQKSTTDEAAILDRALSAVEAEDGSVRELTDVELQAVRSKLKTDATGIQAQLENWNNDQLPEHMLTYEWKRRAINARNWTHTRLNLVRGEITRRQQGKPHETPEAKAARIAKTDAVTRTKNTAYVRAASRYLTREDFDAIWELARAIFPESFEAIHAEEDESDGCAENV